jgi:cardiolipin synthase (CMP-forming)
MGDILPPHKVDLTQLLGRFWTIPNMLSLFRLVLVVPITYLIIVDGPLLWVFGLVLFAVATDYFDGRIARWSNTVSEWGKVLDPLADKVAAVMVVMALVIRGSLPLWLLVIILVRDMLIILGGVMLTKRTGKVVMSLMAGKIAVSVLALTVLGALLRADPPIVEWLSYLTAVLMAISFLLYAGRYHKMTRVKDDGTAAGAPQPE